MWFGLVPVAVISVVALSAPAFAQGLADVARAAEAARKAEADKPSGKVYTNKDLPAADRPAPGTEASGAPVPNDVTSTPQAAPAVKPSPPEPSSSERGEEYWRERMRPLKERLDRDRALAEETRRRADALMQSADRCFQIGVVCADYTESLRLTEDHKALLADVARDEKAVVALEEEARRAGVPPGWLRP